MAGVEESDELKKELVMFVRKEIGPIATIDILQWAPGTAENTLRKNHASYSA